MTTDSGSQSRTAAVTSPAWTDQRIVAIAPSPVGSKGSGPTRSTVRSRDSSDPSSRAGAPRPSVAGADATSESITRSARNVPIPHSTGRELKPALGEGAVEAEHAVDNRMGERDLDHRKPVSCRAEARTVAPPGWDVASPTHATGPRVARARWACPVNSSSQCSAAGSRSSGVHPARTRSSRTWRNATRGSQPNGSESESDCSCTLGLGRLRIPVNRLRFATQLRGSPKLRMRPLLPG